MIGGAKSVSQPTIRLNKRRHPSELTNSLIPASETSTIDTSDDVLLEDDSSEAGEIPFLAMLPPISSSSSLMVRCHDDAPDIAVPLMQSRVSLARTIRRRIPPNVHRYVTRGRLPKYVKVSLMGIVITFAAHMICIAIGMYQMSLIRPEDITILKIHLGDLDKAEGALRAEADIPMPWMARFFHINVANSKVVAQADGQTLFTVEFPDIVVGRRGKTIRMNSIKFKPGTSKSSPLSILLGHLLPFPLFDQKPIGKVKVLMSSRLQTKSFWYPLDIGVNFEKDIDLAELKQKLDSEKKEDSEAPKIKSIKITPKSGELDLSVKATFQLPPVALAHFISIDVPSLEGTLSLLPSNVFESETKPLYIGKGRILPSKLDGGLLNLSDEFQLEAVIDKKAQVALKQIFSSLRDRKTNFVFNFKVNPTPDSFISQMMSIDIKLDLEKIVEGLSVDSKQARLVKRGLSLLKEPKGDTTALMVRSLKRQFHEYGRESIKKHGKPVANVRIKNLKTSDDEISLRATLDIRRDVLTSFSKFDFRLIEGNIPSVTVSLRAEIDKHGEMKKAKLGKIRVYAKECQRGNSDFELSADISFRTDTLRQVLFQPGTRNIIIRGGDNNIISLILDAFEGCLQIGKDSMEFFLTKRLSTTDHWSGQTFHKAKKLLMLEDKYVKRRGHHLRMALDTEDNKISLAVGMEFAKKSVLKEWPFARIEWEQFRFALRPSFSQRKYDRLFRSTTIAELVIPAGGISTNLLPAASPLSLLFDGSVQLLAIVKESRHWPRAGLLEAIKVLSDDYQPDMVRSLVLLHSRSPKSRPDRLIRLAYDKYIVRARSLLRRQTLNNKIDEFVRMNDEMQVAIAGIDNSRINLLVPVPKVGRLPLPKGLRLDTFRISLSLPSIRMIVCDVPSEGKEQHCPVSGGVGGMQVSVILSHNRPAKIKTYHTDYESLRKKNLPLQKYALAFGEIHSFTNVFGFAEDALGPGGASITLGTVSRDLPWDHLTLLDKLVNVAGSRIQMPIPALPKSWNPFQNTRKIKYDRKEYLKLVTSVQSPDPRTLSIHVAAALPRSMVSDDDNTFLDELSRLFVVKWGDMRVKLISSSLGTAEIALRKGQLGLHIHRMLREQGLSLRKFVSAQSRKFNLRVLLELYPTQVADFSSQTIRDFVSAPLFYLDLDVGYIFPYLARCTTTRRCREMIRSSHLYTTFLTKILEAAVSLEVEHESITNMFGGHTKSRVLFVKRGLVMLRKLWKKYGAKVMAKLDIQEEPDISKFFNASISLAPHPEAGRTTEVPSLLPGFSNPKTLGLVNLDKRQLATVNIQIDRVFPLIAEQLAFGLQKLYHILDMDAAPMMLAYKLMAPSLQMSVGINRIDAVELNVHKISSQHLINIPKGTTDHEEIFVNADAQFPRGLSEVAGLLVPFGLDSYGQISVHEQPQLTIDQDRYQLYNSPMNGSIGTARLLSKPNLLSTLIAGLPDIPVFPVTDKVDPFKFAISLEDIRKDELVLKFSGLRFYNPLPGATLTLGKVEAIIIYKEFPFLKLYFGDLDLVHGSNDLPAIIEFSKTAFGKKTKNVQHMSAQDALDEMISLGAAGNSLDVNIIVLINQALALDIPFRLPPRQLPGFSEMFQMSPTVSEDMKSEMMKAGATLGVDLTKDMLATVDASWKSFVAKSLWLDPPPEKKRTGSSKFLDIQLPYSLPWQTSVLSYHVKVKLDKPSEMCPLLLPTISSPVDIYEVKREASSQWLDRCPAIVNLAPGERVTLQRGLVAYEDLPSSVFALQVGSNWWKRGSICATVEVKEVTIRMVSEETPEEPFVLTTKLTGLPPVAATMDQRLRPCPNTSCVPSTLEYRVEDAVDHDYKPESITTLTGAEMFLVISEAYSLNSSYIASIKFIHADTLHFVGFSWRLGDNEVSLRIYPRESKAELIRTGDHKPLMTVTTGAYPLLPGADGVWTRLNLIIRPYHRQLLVEFSSSAETTWASFELDGRLSDYFPQDISGQGLLFGFITQAKSDVMTREFSLQPIKPSFSASSLFHLRPQSYRVFQKGTVGLQLKDTCEKRVGFFGMRLPVRLIRASDAWDYAPWPVKPTLYQYEPLKTVRPFTSLKSPEDAGIDEAIHTEALFDRLDGAYKIDFIGAASGRYRVFVGIRPETVRPGLDWHLLHNHHIFIRQ